MNASEESCIYLYMANINSLRFEWENKRLHRVIILEVKKSHGPDMWYIMASGDVYNFDFNGFEYNPLNSSKDDQWFTEHFRPLTEVIQIVNMILTGHIDPYEEEKHGTSTEYWPEQLRDDPESKANGS